MDRPRFYLIASAAALALGAGIFGCGQATNPAGPSSTSWTDQVLWKDGNPGTWMGQTATVILGTPATATDTVTGDTTVLSTGTGTEVSFAVSSAEDIFSTFGSGRITFDMELGPDFNSTNVIVVEYGNRNTSAECTSAALSGLTTTAFTAVTVPIASDFGTCNDTTSVNYNQFLVQGNGTLVGVQFYINNVQWLADN